MSEIRLSWQIDGGAPGIDSDPQNPLSRATRSPLLDGRPQTSLSLTFYSDPGMDGQVTEPCLRWLGAFVLSAGGRVIFFPGFDFEATWIGVGRRCGLEKRFDIKVDHISLEKDHCRWHFTGAGSVDHVGSGRTGDLGEGRYLWFGMSVAEASVLRLVKEETVSRAVVPASDADRRTKALVASRDGAVFNMVSLHSQAKALWEVGFLHLALVVGPSGFPAYEGDELGVPFGSPFLKESLPVRLNDMAVRSHRIDLGGRIDIQVVTMWLPGSLSVGVMFTGPMLM